MSARVPLLLLLLLAGVLLAAFLARPGRETGAAAPAAGRGPAADPGPAAEFVPPKADPAAARAGFAARATRLPADPPAWLARALEQLEDDADPLKLEARLESLLARIPGEQTPAVLDQLGRLPGPAAAALGERLVRRWAAAAPAEATRWVLELPGAPRADWLVQAALGWAEADLPAARDWAAGLADAPAQREARLAIAHELARHDPVPALDLAAGLQPGADRDQFLDHGVAQWAAADPAAAAAWVAQLPAGTLRETLFIRALVAEAGRSSGPPPSLLLEHLPPGPAREAATLQIAQRRVQDDPVATLDWLAALPDEVLRRQAAGPALDIWLHLDPEGLGRWLGDAPPGDLRDLALGRIARFTARTNASAAGTWAELIGDPALRAETYARLPATP